MAVSVNRSAQQDKKESIPLANAWYKEHESHKNLYLGVTGLKPSRSGEWLLVEICGKFMAILHSESSQAEALMEMIQIVEEEGHTLVACYSTHTKSGIEFGLDDEVKGWVKFMGHGEYSISWERTVDGPFLTPNNPDPITPPLPKRRSKKSTGLSGATMPLETPDTPF